MAHDPKQTNPKHDAAKKCGDFGHCGFLVCRDLDELESCLKGMLKPKSGDVKAGL